MRDKSLLNAQDVVSPQPSRLARCMAPSTLVRRWGNCFSSCFTRSAVSFRGVTPSAGQALYTMGRASRRAAPVISRSSQKTRGRITVIFFRER